MKLAEGFLKGEDRDDARSLILKHAGLLPAEEQLQLIFTLGEIGTPATDANPAGVDDDRTGEPPPGGRRLGARRGRTRTRVPRRPRLDPACAQMRDTHRLLLSGLSRCVAVEGAACRRRIQHLLDLIASRPAGDWQQVALLDGISSTLPAARAGQPAPRIKPVVFASEPAAWKTLAAVESEEVKKRVASIDRMIAWPGKPGMQEIKIAVPLQGDDLASFNRGKERLHDDLRGVPSTPRQRSGRPRAAAAGFRTGAGQ
jgi:hypothetical protein